MAISRKLTQSAHDIFYSAKPEKTYGKITQAGHHLRSIAGADLMAVFVEGHVSYIMRTVFDAPVFSVEGKQTFGAGLLRGKRGDAIDRLAFRLAGFKVGPFPFNFDDLLTVWEAEVAVEKCGGAESSDFEPSVSFIDCLVGRGKNRHCRAVRYRSGDFFDSF